MKTIEEILAAQQAIVDTAKAENRSLNDDEAKQYETLETELRDINRTHDIEKRQAAYMTPNASLAAVVNVTAVKEDDTLDRAFTEYLRTGQGNADIAELRAQNSGTGSAGGYIAPDTFRAKVVEIQHSYGGVAPFAETLNTENGNDLEYASNDDTNVGVITAESASVSGGADLTFGQVQLGAYKYTSSGAGNAPLRVPVELIQDAFIDIDAYVARKLGTRIAKKQALDWAVGTGSGMPDGICRAALTPDHELATGATITYNDLLDLEAALDPAYEQNARWVFNKATWTAIRKLVDDNGRPLILEQAASGIGGAPQKTLLGYPVTLDSSFPDPTGDFTNFAILGDIAEAYVIRRVSPLVVARSEHTRIANFEVEFVAMERADGTVQNRAAMVVLATENTA